MRMTDVENANEEPVINHLIPVRVSGSDSQDMKGYDGIVCLRQLTDVKF